MIVRRDFRHHRHSFFSSSFKTEITTLSVCVCVEKLLSKMEMTGGRARRTDAMKTKYVLGRIIKNDRRLEAIKKTESE